MRHDMDRPASGKRLVRGTAGIHRQRIESAADAGIGAEQRDRAELPFGFLDHVKNVLLLGDIAFECRTLEFGRNRSRGGAVDIDHDHLGGTGAMKRLAQRPAYAVGTAGDDHDLAGHLHRPLPLFV